MRQPVSAVLITLNAERLLKTCLDSLGFADEILVVDSGSTDATVRLAEQAGARVVQQPWLGFGPQKRFAVEQAAHDWVLCVDADEWLSPRLREEIPAVLAHPAYRAYRMPRCNRFLGRWLRHGEGYPDWSLRLFDRRHAQWSEDVVHEQVLTQTPVGRLRGDLMHQSEDGVADYIAKQNRYTTLQAQRLHAAGKRPRALRMCTSPLLRFVKFYFLRGGIRDGVPGLIHILIGCFNSFAKYAKLYELSRGRR